MIHPGVVSEGLDFCWWSSIIKTNFFCGKPMKVRKSPTKIHNNSDESSWLSVRGRRRRREGVRYLIDLRSPNLHDAFVEDEEDKTSVPTICMRTDINSGIACLSLGRFFFYLHASHAGSLTFTSHSYRARDRIVDEIEDPEKVMIIGSC